MSLCLAVKLVQDKQRAPTDIQSSHCSIANLLEKGIVQTKSRVSCLRRKHDVMLG